MDKVSPYSRKTLRAMARLKEADLEKLASESGLTVDQTRKAVEELKEKGLVEVKVKVRKIVYPGSKLKSLGNKLPERIIVEKLKEIGGEAEIEELRRNVQIPNDDFSAGLGKAIEKGLIKLEKRNGERWLFLARDEEMGDEKLISKLVKAKKLDVSALSKDELSWLNSLVKRPEMIEFMVKREERVKIKSEGVKVARELREVETVSQLTRELIKSGKWREVTFEGYDLNAKSYQIYGGRSHPLREVIKEIREIFLEMGFEEINDSLIQLAFWNFDALFQPQDHPARDMQDTFYLESPAKRELTELDVVERVKETHLNGWITGSTGWGGSWRHEEACKLVLRTHTTVATIKKVYETGNKPLKAFIIGSVFRNEKMDYKHSAEFHQVDGIVIDRRANVRQLMGILKEFYNRLGLKRVRFMPSYFPYTEPSIQTSVYVEKLRDWVELAGMGIFRPEVTKPLGVDWPVLAWGCGVERIVMIKYDVSDIRELYRCDIGWLRRRPIRKYLY